MARMPATAPPPPLPVAAHREALLAALRAHQVVLCVGETGSGKTTQIPQFILAALRELQLPADAAMAVTQPRRVAAISVAHRVAEEMHTPIGREVGFRVRFQDVTSSATRLTFLTDGVLVREALRDPMLRRYAVLMLDEAHERSLDTDVLLGLLPRMLRDRPELKLLVASATLDTARLAAFFQQQMGAAEPPAIVKIPGRAFPVEIRHAKRELVMGPHGPLSMYLRATIETTLQLHHSQSEGHILVFLTGQHEIERACTEIRELARQDVMQMRVCPLYSALSSRRQREVFAPVPANVRKIVVATNIAETSLTIDGVRFVVDCGFTKQRAYDPQQHREALVVVPVSKVAAQQRAGRAGRTAPGQCFRLYSKQSYAKLLEATVPELQRTNLAHVVLALKVLGVHKVLDFAFLDPPPEDALLDALVQVRQLGALDEQGHVTPLGVLMARLPLDPPLARVLLEAAVLECGNDMAHIVAMLSVDRPLILRPRRDHGRGHDRAHEMEDRDGEDEDAALNDDAMIGLAQAGLLDADGDHLTYLRVLKAFEGRDGGQRQQWCERLSLDARALGQGSDICKQLKDIISDLRMDEWQAQRQQEESRDGDRDAVGFRPISRSQRLCQSICSGFSSQAVLRCGAQSDVYRPFGAKQGQPIDVLYLHPLSVLRFVSPPGCCVYQTLESSSRRYMRHVVRVDPAYVQRWQRRVASILPSLEETYVIGGRRHSPRASSHQEEVCKPNPSPSVSTCVELPHKSKRNADADAKEAEIEPKLKRRRDQIAAARARFLARKQSQPGDD